MISTRQISGTGDGDTTLPIKELHTSEVPHERINQAKSDPLGRRRRLAHAASNVKGAHGKAASPSEALRSCMRTRLPKALSSSSCEPPRDSHSRSRLRASSAETSLGRGELLSTVMHSSTK